jgi:signal transduction histidine kinase/CheY-like chemotaxis protein
MTGQDLNFLDLKTLQAHSIYRPLTSNIGSEPESELQYLQCQLAYEQTLHQLDIELNDYVLAFLADTEVECLESDGYAEDAIFQTLVQRLSQGLGNVPAAIAFPHPSDNPAEIIYELQQVAPCLANPKAAIFTKEDSSTATWSLSYQKIRFEPGQSFTQQELSQLQARFPNDIRPIVQHSTGVLWLLLDRVSLGISQYPDLEEHWIEQMLSRCVMTLEQIRRIQLQRRRQQDLLQRNRELEQTNQLKSEFLANTSHEIRTPLSSILGFTHLLQQQGYNPINLRHQEYLKIILTSGQHLLALINDILDLSKIEANQLSLEWETVDVAKVCEVALMLVREKASDRGLALQLEIDPAVERIVVDSLRLKQMLFNLLSNAVKFTLSGSIGLQVLLLDEYLHFAVWDTGTGISKEHQAALFKPYSQIANDAVTRGEGTGLGLVLTQKLAELHGGWVEIVSALNQGSRFTIVLPVQPTLVASSALRPSLLSDNGSPLRLANRIEHPPFQPTPRFSSGSDRPTPIAPPPIPDSALKTSYSNNQGTEILLVEDNLHNAKLVLTYLNRLGHQIRWAKDGVEMWKLLNGSLPDETAPMCPALILMDINLPGVDGLTLTRQLKANAHYAHIPVIAQTAMAMKGDRDLCLSAGADGYLSKPIDLDALAALVNKYVSVNEENTLS